MSLTWWPIEASEEVFLSIYIILSYKILRIMYIVPSYQWSWLFKIGTSFPFIYTFSSLFRVVKSESVSDRHTENILIDVSIKAL